MYDIEQLEREWRRYRQKRVRRYVLAGTALAALVGIGVYMSKDILHQNSTSISLAKKSKNLQPSLQSQGRLGVDNILVNDSFSALQKQNMPVLKKQKRDTPPVEQVVEIPILQEPLSEEIPTEKTAHKQRSASKSEAGQRVGNTSHTHKKLSIKVVSPKNETVFRDLQRRFYQTHSAEDSLFLARAYYNKGAYKKAAYWAMQTNKINADIEESWILFARSKWQQGYKSEAIEALVLYLSRSDSVKAKNLLKKFRSNL